MRDLEAENARLRKELARYSMGAGEADLCRLESQLARVALGFDVDDGDVCPADIRDGINTLKARVATLREMLEDLLLVSAPGMDTMLDLSRDRAREVLAALAQSPKPPENCERCNGCGRIADSTDGEPWTAWEELPPGADIAVRIGVVKPIPCPACKGAAPKPPEAATTYTQRCGCDVDGSATDAFFVHAPGCSDAKPLEGAREGKDFDPDLCEVCAERTEKTLRVCDDCFDAPRGCPHETITPTTVHPDGSIDGTCLGCGETGFPIRDVAFEQFKAERGDEPCAFEEKIHEALSKPPPMDETCPRCADKAAKAVGAVMLRSLVYGMPSFDALEGELVAAVRAALSNGGGK